MAFLIYLFLAFGIWHFKTAWPGLIFLTEHKATDCWCNCTHLCDTSWYPDMIVLQHHHPTQILSVHGHTTNQHGVLLHQTKSWGGLARSSHLSLPASLCCHGLQLGTAGSNPWSPGQAIESRPFTKEEASCWASHHSSQSNGIWTCGGVVRLQNSDEALHT